MMRIGIEAQRIFRRKKHGMDFVALELIRQLQELDQHNQYFVFVNHGPDRQFWQAKDNFALVEFGGAYPWWEQVRLPLLARRYRLDLLHSTGNTAPLLYAGRQLVTLHDIIFFEINPWTAPRYNWYQRLGNIYRRWLLRKLLRKEIHWITVSHFEKERICSTFKLAESKVSVVYNGVGEHFKPSASAESDTNRPSQAQAAEGYCLFFGNTDPKKNTLGTIAGFVHFCRHYPEHRQKLLIADFEPSRLRQYLRKLGAEDLSPRFAVLDYVKNEELPHLLKGADAFLYPSLRESFGIPPLEAMRCGTPVLAANRAALPEIGQDALWLCEPDSPEDIARQLHYLLTEDFQRQRKIQRGLERSMYFSWRQTAEKTLNLYRQLHQHESLSPP